MKITELNLSVVYVNLARREDRRAETEYLLARHGLSAQRQPGIRREWVGDPRGFHEKRRYACSLAKRLAIRRGMMTGADAVLLLEDDVVFHPEFQQRWESIELPTADWGLFYLGAWHLSPPAVAGPGLLRCRRATTNHAVIVNRPYYWRVMRALGGLGKGASGQIAYSDARLADCQDEIPAFAVWPNLIWQAGGFSNTSEGAVTYFDEEGRQTNNRSAVAGLDGEMQRFPGGDNGPPSPVPSGAAGMRVWMHADEWRAIAERLPAGARVLEWGAGGSTWALAKVAREVVSIEHDAAFAEERLAGLPENVTLEVVAPEWGAAAVWTAEPGQFWSYVRRGTERGVFDAVLVDGRARVECALAAAESGALRPGGWLFFHDWPHRERYTRRLAELERWYTLEHVIADTPQGMAVFRRR